jgi:hypothetical protein
MRKLSEEELNKIRKAIAVKELTSAEILLEVYDHYVSHLESKSVEEFEVELFELEQKFTYGYCHALQGKLFKSAKKEIFGLQWSLFKSYFSWPRIVFTAAFLTISLFMWSWLDEKTRMITLFIPFALSAILTIGIVINSFRKVRRVRKYIKCTQKIESTFAIWIFQPMLILAAPFSLMSSSGPDSNIITDEYLPAVSFLFLIIYSGFFLTLLETWKIKSKTALI